jgi:hypothetical protein
MVRSLLALPPVAMEITRRQARADLVGEFARDTAEELAEVTTWWWSEETQKVRASGSRRLPVRLMSVRRDAYN